jgi:hypothetical protein
VIPLSNGVLAAALVVASPALWRWLVVGTMPAEVAVTRYLVAVAVCWVVLSVVADLAFPAPGTVRSTPESVPEPVDE